MDRYPVKCFDCGKFCKPAAWKMLYSGVLPEPDREIFKCQKCLNKNGMFEVQSHIEPKYSCGLFK